MPTKRSAYVTRRRRNAKSRKGGKGLRSKSRRLGAIGAMPFVPETGASDYTRTYNPLKGAWKKAKMGLPFRAETRLTGVAGRGRVAKANSTNSDVNGFVVNGRLAHTKKTIIENRKKRIIQAMMDERFPLVRRHQLVNCADLDWTNNEQGVTQYQIGFTTSMIESIIQQANAANYQVVLNTDANGIGNPDTGTSQRVHINTMKSIFTLKNTCTHTCTLEFRVYRTKAFPNKDPFGAWVEGMTKDNGLPQLLSAAGITVDETFNSLGNRPKMSMPELGARCTENVAARAKMILEPGQQSTYTVYTPGFRYDQAYYNVLTGSSTDPEYCPQTHWVMVFAEAEIVTDLNSERQTKGSGHITVLLEQFYSFQAVPLVKPVQNLFTNAWAGFDQTGEEDNNQYVMQNNEPYVENA